MAHAEFIAEKKTSRFERRAIADGANDQKGPSGSLPGEPQRLAVRFPSALPHEGNCRHLDETAEGSGAGDGNRTHASSLGSYSSTIELHPLGVWILAHPRLPATETTSRPAALQNPSWAKASDTARRDGSGRIGKALRKSAWRKPGPRWRTRSLQWCAAPSRPAKRFATAAIMEIMT